MSVVGAVAGVAGIGLCFASTSGMNTMFECVMCMVSQDKMMMFMFFFHVH